MRAAAEIRQAADITATGDMNLIVSRPEAETDPQYRARFLELIAALLCDPDRAVVESRLCRLTSFAVSGYERDEIDAAVVPLLDELIERIKLHHVWHGRQHEAAALRSVGGPGGPRDWQALLMYRDNLSRVLQQFPEAVAERAWPRGRTTPAMVVEWALQLKQASVLLWSEAIWQAACRGAGSFTDEPVREAWIPRESVLWFWNNRRGLDDALRSDPHHHAVFSLPQDADLFCALVGPAWAWQGGRGEQPPASLTPGPGQPVAFSQIEIWLPPRQDDPRLAREPVGWDPAALPHLVTICCPVGERVSVLQAEYLAASRFLSLPLAEAAPAAMSRQQRRHYEQKHGAPPPVRVVVLRKRGERRANPEEHSAREFHCHFLVRDHWRRRADCWGKGEGPIYVSAHVKGDREQPFRPPRATIYQAKR